VCVCSLSYPVYKAHAPYYMICGMSGCAIFFPHYLINDTTFGNKKELLNIKYVLIFSTNFVGNIFHSKKNSARNDHKGILVFVKYPLFLSDSNGT